MKISKLIIKSSSGKYPIFIGSNIISNISKLIFNNSINFEKCLLVVDKNVPKKFISEIKKSLKNKKLFIFLITANEKNKNQKTTNLILQILLDKNFSREDCLIAVGGGITGDVSGFAASLFKRGLKFINIPTTLLSQVDSSIGGKTGINTNQGKNLIGSFYQPRLVISDTNFLKTLSKREVICGYGEILKHAIISNKVFYNFLNKNFFNIIKLKSPFIDKAIYESCKIKKIVVEKDEKENGMRKILNFGHTLGHAIESYYLTHPEKKRLLHGEAIAIGMVMEAYLGVSCCSFSNVAAEEIKKTFAQFYPPVEIDAQDREGILELLRHDKKNKAGRVNFVLLKSIGVPEIDVKVPQELFTQAFEFYGNS